MRTIYQYQLKAADVITAEFPKNAKILTVQTQGNTPCIWMEVDSEAVKEKRVFEIYGTGHPMSEVKEPSERKYIGTYQLHGGALVFHLFEIITKA